MSRYQFGQLYVEIDQSTQYATVYSMAVSDTVGLNDFPKATFQRRMIMERKTKPYEWSVYYTDGTLITSGNLVHRLMKEVALFLMVRTGYDAKSGLETK